MKNLFTFYLFIWFLLAIWAVSEQFVECEILPKWYVALGGFAIGMWIWVFCKRTFPDRLQIYWYIFPFSVLLCAVSQAIYGMWQWRGFAISFMTGSFDNPAGLSSLLAFSIPFGCYGVTVVSSRLRPMVMIGTIILCIAILMTESRTGIFTTLVVLFLHFRKYLIMHRKKLVFVFSVLFAIILVALYYYKKDSANGRMLIWKCTLEMIGDGPWQGYGHNGFRCNYMNYQAEYFQQHPDCHYAMLADDVKHPFNEYLYLLTNYGFWGGFAVMAFAVWLIHTWRKHPTGSSRPAMLCLIAIAVFSMFSYPFRYPHTWILCIYSVVVLSDNLCKVCLRIWQWLLCCFSLFFSLFVFSVFRRIPAEVRWRKAVDCSLCGMTEEMLPVYKGLYKELRSDPLFLYNYAAELNVAGRYEESLRISEECEKQLADYSTQLLLADNYRHLEKYEEAIYHLTQASYMCPNRFVPLYELYEIHKIQHDSTAMDSIGQTILTKSIKIDSPEIRRIIRNVNEDFKKSYQ